MPENLIKAYYRGVVVPSFVLESTAENSSEWAAFQRGVDSVYALSTEVPESEYPKYWVSESGDAYYRLLKEPETRDSFEVDAFYVHPDQFEPKYLTLNYVDEACDRIDPEDLPKELGW